MGGFRSFLAYWLGGASSDVATSAAPPCSVHITATAVTDVKMAAQKVVIVQITAGRVVSVTIRATTT